MPEQRDKTENTHTLKESSMVHLGQHCCGDDHRAMCGRPVKGERVVEKVDCVVCAEIARAGQFCSRCGSWMQLL